jgi:hypothetical protein
MRSRIVDNTLGVTRLSSSGLPDGRRAHRFTVKSMLRSLGVSLFRFSHKMPLEEAIDRRIDSFRIWIGSLAIWH